jgi:hypothetical protein
MKISISEHAGSFAEDKDIARRLRAEVIEKALGEKKLVVLDFTGVELATQSFVHALICDVIRKHGAGVLDRLTFQGCNPTLKSLITVVSAYSQDDEG